MFNKIEEIVEIAPGKEVRFETGRMAKQAGGACVIQMGDAMLLTTMCLGAVAPSDFFPLTVEYKEKAYAAGKIPGGYIKREARPSDGEILTARLIDRPIRPMFPEGFRNEVQIISQVISSRLGHPEDILGISSASVAVGLSDVPFEEQVAGVRVISLNGEFVVNPSLEEISQADIELVMAGTANSVCMVEGGAYEVSESLMIDAIMFGHEAIKKMVAAQDKLIARAGKTKFVYPAPVIDEELYAKVKTLADGPLNVLLHKDMVKSNFYPAIAELKKEIITALEAEGDIWADRLGLAKAYFEDIERTAMRQMILTEGRRIDGRTVEAIRDITIETGVLPSGHGSVIFQRGETQALVVATLGSKSDEQRIDTLHGEVNKNYMLHYNFPPFSVGECKRLGQSRREIGHGHLAERSLYAVLPHPEDFPYTLRIVSEILESNGSSSMASVCGGSLSLMDAGVPIKAPVAGIAMGLISEGDQVKILSDITGTEDHLGDMDFKITGTREGVTAFQMDIKIKGITPELMRSALDQARRGREHILGEMDKVLANPRPELSPNAPAILNINIPVAKIREVIGPGGNVIRGIQAQTGTSISIDDDGRVTIAAPSKKGGDMAMKMLKEIVSEAEVNKVYKGKVKGIQTFGAFVEILPGKEGLVHISEFRDEKVERVEDVVSLGDEIEVLCIGVDPKGKIKLSVKQLRDVQA